MPRILDNVRAAHRPPRQAKAGIPPGKGAAPGQQGQAPFVATDAQRARVMTLVACGFINESISVIMAIPIATLERHFAWELTHGKLAMDARILGGIVESALNGDKTISIFYAKTRGGWRERGESAEPAALFSININNGPSDAAPEISVIARPIHSLPEPEEQP